MSSFFSSFYNRVTEMWIDLLYYVGFYGKVGKVVFLGLDNAGKTTLLHLLKHDVLQQLEPTQRPTSEEFKIGNISIQAFDLGGHKEARETWDDYCVNAAMVLFVVDASDRERVPEANKELDALLRQHELRNTPFVILGNKVDMPGAMSEDELRSALFLKNTTGKKTTRSNERAVEVFMTSLVKRFGYQDAIQWGTNFIK